ncbi:MAG TPA: thiamine pyrophosphate-dependent enzyme, partial [Bacteroidia bacterium]
MLKQTIEILTSYKKPKKVCVMGNVAVARGAIEAGVSGVFSYPGTPSTEISEVFNYVNDFQSKEENEKKFPKQTAHKIYFEYSINEKIALEKAIAYSIGNKKAMCVMKNVGMNVASDALMSIAYQTIVAPLVIIICDDPGCFSSSNEQDSRYWGKFASIPMLNPATPEDACSMTFEAFSISEKLKLPVIVRMTTRVDHSRGVIEYSEIKTKEDKAHFDRLPQHINIPARTAAAHKVLLEKFNNELFSISNRKNNYLVSENKKSPIAIIAGGVATVYAQELLSRIPKSKNIPVLKLGVLHPFPESDVLKFLKRSFKKVLVLEELDPLVENEVRIVTQKNKIKTEILGKGFEGLSSTGEYTLDILCNALEKFTGQTLRRKNQKLIEGAGDFLSNISPRPPVLCAGCPHRSTFYALKLAIPRDDGKIIMCGDIGCFGLGALPPLQMIDTINHMGMSVSMAQGLSEALRLKTEQGKIVALLGDGTFFHSGVASLINAIYTRANITVIIFDNRTIGMTGHQDHPGATHERSKYKQIDIYSLVKGLGVELVENINPFELHDTYDKVKNAIGHQGVSVLIAKSPCIFLPDFKDGTFVKKSVRVNPDKCNTCFNHCDMSIACSREQSPKGNLVRARAKITAGEHIFGQEQLCPANICNHGFFNSILSGNYKEALEIVRDKMLFARVCGDICHRPCESLFRMENGSSV